MKFFVVFCFLASLAMSMAQFTMNEERPMQRKLKTDERTLQAVQEHHERRMEKLREMIEERRQTVEDHESGRRKLAADEFELASRQLKNFSRKLKVMEASNNREDHLDRIEEMASLNDPRRLDNMAVQEKLGKFHHN